jgi:hypothetical protein
VKIRGDKKHKYGLVHGKHSAVGDEEEKPRIRPDVRVSD